MQRCDTGSGDRGGVCSGVERCARRTGRAASLDSMSATWPVVTEAAARGHLALVQAVWWVIYGSSIVTDWGSGCARAGKLMS